MTQATAQSLTPSLLPSRIVLLPIGQLAPDPNQPRTEFDEAALKALATDIGERGIEQPIVVRSDYTIKDGERRWRAAKLAKLTAVPCILAADVPAENGAVEYLLDQVADNHHREPLGPLDWAHTLTQLVAQHNLDVKDLPGLLAKRGITMSRSYCSNLMRLIELPEWAQAWIREGKLTATHGKHILIAKDSPRALQRLHRDLKRMLQHEREAPPTTNDIHRQVTNAFDEVHIDLDNRWGNDRPQFDVKTCEGCPNRKVIGNQDGFADRVFCLDAPCFKKKQVAAIAKAEQKQAAERKADGRTKSKPSAREIADRRRERARLIVRERTVEQIIKKTEGGLNLADQRLIAKALVCEMQHNTLKELFARRHWEPKKAQYGHNYLPVAYREIGKMDEAGLAGLLMECALRGNLTIGYYAHGTDYLAETAKRYKVNLKTLEKSALAELTPKTKPGKKPIAAPRKPTAKKKAHA